MSRGSSSFRSGKDTFYVVDNAPEGKESHVLGDHVLLSYTDSGVQVHTMETKEPPIYMICPGTVARPDTADANHLGLSLRRWKALLLMRESPWRPQRYPLITLPGGFAGLALPAIVLTFFPFTEPSCEVDVSAAFATVRAAASARTRAGLRFLVVLG